jgi:hypothetical protein
MTRYQRTWEHRPNGWRVMLTIGQSWGLGFMAYYVRYNGVDFYLGPICLTVQPPAPPLN